MLYQVYTIFSIRYKLYDRLLCRIRAVFLLFLSLPLGLAAQMPWNIVATPPKHETRAVWLTTLNGLDWPKIKATDEDSRRRQKEELCQLLDQLKAAHINTILLQTRIRGSVIYPSSIEPWDAALTGQYDRHPGYDPLAYAIEQAHARGMELHTWVVSVPAFKQEIARRMGRRSLLVTHPTLLKKFQGMYYLDPSEEESARYLAALCKEIVEKYDVDGIHLDYIRYPENAISFPDALSFSRYGRGLTKADWRRENITRMVREISRVIRKQKPYVKLSCSPVGKYRDTRRQSAGGWNAYDAVYQDAKLWMRNGWMDLIFPMMYFTGENFYPFLTDWQENSACRPIVPGLGIYFLSENEKNWPLSIISAQMNVARQQGCSGQAFFRSQFLTSDTKGLYSLLKNTFYAYAALPTPMPWLDGEVPSAPTDARFALKNGQVEAQWSQSPGNSSEERVYYNVYASTSYPVDTKDARHLIAQRLESASYCYNPFSGLYLAVTAMDRAGNESQALQLNDGMRKDTQSHYLCVQDGYLALPSQTDVSFYLITDLSGKHISSGKWGKKINVKALRPGIYRLRTLQKRGQSRLVGEFLR